MKRILIIIGWIFTFTYTCAAQDVITTRDSKKIYAKVIEINSNYITFKYYNNLDGPTYMFQKKDIISIHYQNGRIEFFQTEKVKTTQLENGQKSVIPSGRTVLADMKTNNPEMFAQYKSATKKHGTGIVLTGIGGGTIVMGAIFSSLRDSDNGTIKLGSYIIENGGDNSGFRAAGTVLMVGGAICLSVGLPVMISGRKKKNQIFQNFRNQYYITQQPSSYFQINIYPNRVGIAYAF